METLLLKKIEDCRKKMVQLAADSSLSNEKVIETSKKLDDLLNKYDMLSEKKAIATSKSKRAV